MNVKVVLKKEVHGGKEITTFETVDGVFHTLVKGENEPVHHYEYHCTYDNQNMANRGHDMAVLWYGMNVLNEMGVLNLQR